MSKKRSKVRFQNEVDLIKVHYKKQSRGQSLTCLDMFNGRRHLRKRSVAGILCGSLFLTVISATVLGKTTTVVYASDIEKYTNADFAMDTVVSETLYTSGADIIPRLVKSSAKWKPPSFPGQRKTPRFPS